MGEEPSTYIGVVLVGKSGRVDGLTTLVDVMLVRWADACGRYSREGKDGRAVSERVKESPTWHIERQTHSRRPRGPSIRGHPWSLKRESLFRRSSQMGTHAQTQN